MKKIAFLALGLMAAIQFAAADDRPITYDKLPEQAKQTIANYFGEWKVLSAIVDRDGADTTYEVILEGASTIEFDRRGNWKEIHAGSGIPTGILPAGISEFVSINHPEQRIVKVERDRRHYEVKLDNRLELKFDRNQRFIKYD